ncbi:MAG: dihydrofolate reductase [Treponema sp.]|nr:dihydrofolate reductase [Treponema sp.]
MDIVIIAAVAENGVIGINNALPWSLKEDMERFRELTLGWPCVMGRKTWESLPKRPLPGRLNIVISRTLTEKEAPGAEVLPSLEDAVRRCACYRKIFICGGASVYREALPLATQMEITLIHRRFEGDAFFPEIDQNLWKKAGAADFDGFSFVSYYKKQQEE